jgi:hypothetical protein
VATTPPSKAGSPGVATFDKADCEESNRQKRLKELWSYYKSRQYDAQGYDWDGEKLGENGGSAYTTVVNREPVPANFTVTKPPTKFRRPNTIYALPKVITNRFTAMLFGEDHFPTAQCNDQPTEDFCHAFLKHATIQHSMVQARGVGGATGSVACFLGLRDGLFRLESFKPWQVEVTRWEDEFELIPGEVVVQYKYKRQVVDEDKQKLVEKEFWYRRVIDETSDTTFDPVEVGKEDETPEWTPAENGVVEHNLGFCPVVWIQNLPSEDDSEDGESDYEPALTLFNQINRELSGIYQGDQQSMDPVPVLKTDEEISGPVIKSGSQWVTPGKDGDAHYMETTGAGIKTAMDNADKFRKIALESCECVLVDPDKFSASAQSGVAIKQLYQPMLAKLGLLRTQWGEKGLVPILKMAIKMAQLVAQQAVQGAASDETIPKDPETQQPVIDTSSVIRMPPRKVTDPEGQEAEVPHDPMLLDGEAEITLSWPPPFPPTYEDLQAAATAIAGLKALGMFTMETLMDKFSGLLDVKDPGRELAAAKQEATEAGASIASSLGGGVLPGQKAPPPVAGGKGKPGGAPPPKPAGSLGGPAAMPKSTRADGPGL